MGQTIGKRVLDKDGLTKDERKQRLRQSQQWRYEVGPQDAPPDRPAPPFQLRSMFVADFLKTQRDLIVIPSSASVAEALDILNLHTIHSAPVLEKVSGRYMGVLSLNDLNAFLLSHHQPGSSQPTEQALKTEVSSLVNYLDANDVVMVRKNDTLRDVVKKMRENKVHRLLVVDYQDHVVAVISQMGLLRILHENIDDLYDKPDATLQEMGLSEKPVATCSQNSKAVEALTILRDHKYGALGVVNEEGSLVGELNLSEVRTMDEEQHRNLAELSVKEFLSSDVLYVCPPSTTLRQAVQRLHESKHYRLFVCDPSNKPRGIVTLTDLLERIA